MHIATIFTGLCIGFFLHTVNSKPSPPMSIYSRLGAVNGRNPTNSVGNTRVPATSSTANNRNVDCPGDNIFLGRALVRRGDELEKAGNFIIALETYQNGLEFWLKEVETQGYRNDDTQNSLKSMIEVYMDKAEAVKKKVESSPSPQIQLGQTNLNKPGPGRYSPVQISETSQSHVRQIEIKWGSTGYSYATIFSKFLDNTVFKIEIDEPWMAEHHHVQNLVRFAELCVQKCGQLKTVVLKTKKSKDFVDQQKKLDVLKKSLLEKQVELRVVYLDNLHYREIRIDNGYVLKLRRGLDYFQAVPQYTLGSTDMDLRQCKDTTIDIYKLPN